MKYECCRNYCIGHAFCMPDCRCDGNCKICKQDNIAINIEEIPFVILFRKKCKKVKKALAIGKIIMYTKHCCDIDSVEA